MATGDVSTALTVEELKEILDDYGDDVAVVVEGRNEEALNVEVEDDIAGSGHLIIRGGLPVDA